MLHNKVLHVCTSTRYEWRLERATAMHEAGKFELLNLAEMRP